MNEPSVAHNGLSLVADAIKGFDPTPNLTRSQWVREATLQIVLTRLQKKDLFEVNAETATVEIAKNLAEKIYDNTRGRI
jgi:hypothetical protein